MKQNQNQGQHEDHVLEGGGEVNTNNPDKNSN